MNLRLYNRTFIVMLLIICLTSCKMDQQKSETNLVEKNEKPNVVLILVDDLGWTDLGSYGSDLYQTPNIDKLANEGVKFTNSYASCTVCSPTRASIVTGKYPARINVTDWIKGHKYPWAKLDVPDWTMYLPKEEYTMAEAFKDAGYKTAHFGKWHLGEEEENWPENHGFDINVGGWEKGAPHRDIKKGYKGYFSPYGNPRLKDGPEGEYLTERLSTEVCNYIEESRDQPFFVNLWFYNVHKPLQAKEYKISKFNKLTNATSRHQNATYAAMVEHMDDAVGKVVEKLKEKGLYENTIILFSSDNGGLIGNSKNVTTNNAPLRDGKGSIYEGGVRIPTIIHAPKLKIQNKEIDEPIISMDYYPTLMELAGISNSKIKNQTVDGRSLVPLMQQNKNLKRDAVFWHYPHYHQEGGVPYSSVRKGNWKLFENFETNSFELYNLENDISESKNLINEKPDLVNELKNELKVWRNSVNAQLPTLNNNFIKSKERKKK